MKTLRAFWGAALLLLVAVPASGIKILSGPYLQNVTPTEATIVWVTDSDALSWVETAPDDGLHFYAQERPKYFATSLGRALIGKVNKVKVTGLTPGQTVRYRVYSREVLDQQPYSVKYGDVAATDVFTKEPLKFKALPLNSPSVRFKVVNDVHEDSVLFADHLSDFTPEKYDFVVCNGDMTNFMGNQEQVLDKFLTRATALFASETPLYMVRGNHESRGNHASHYMDYYVTPTGKPYYTFTRGPICFIVLDGGEDKPDTDIEYSGTCFSDAYRQEQADWLKEVVVSKEYKDAKYHVVIVHVPPVGDTWHGPLHAGKLFLPILNNADVDVMLCAHLHRYKYIKPGEEGADFPVLINSNMESLSVEANRDKMQIDVADRSGKVVHSFTYPAR